MQLSLVDCGKICGILFFIVMVWYFAFVVFKTNKDFLVSLTQHEEEPTSLTKMTSLFGSDNVIKGFTEGFKEGMTSEQEIGQEKLLKRTLEEATGIKAVFEDMAHTGKSGRPAHRKLIKQILQVRLKTIKDILVVYAGQHSPVEDKFILTWSNMRDKYQQILDDFTENIEKKESAKKGYW